MGCSVAGVRVIGKLMCRSIVDRLKELIKYKGLQGESQFTY